MRNQLGKGLATCAAAVFFSILGTVGNEPGWSIFGMVLTTGIIWDK